MATAKIDPSEVSELSNLMREAGVRDDNIEIVLAAYQSKSFESTTTDLRMTQGRVKHRFFEACRVLEAKGDSKWSTLLLNSVR